MPEGHDLLAERLDANVDQATLLASHTRSCRGVLTRPRYTGGAESSCMLAGRTQSFFATLEKELLALQPAQSRRNMREQVANYIESYYNLVRLHSRPRLRITHRVRDQRAQLIQAVKSVRQIGATPVEGDKLVLHADNGGPMNGCTLLATLQRLGVVPSFSRLSVSDDNPFAEALFRTLKYRPNYPRKPFQSLMEAIERVECFESCQSRHRFGDKFFGQLS